MRLFWLYTLGLKRLCRLTGYVTDLLSLAVNRLDHGSAVTFQFSASCTLVTRCALFNAHLARAHLFRVPNQLCIAYAVCACCQITETSLHTPETKATQSFNTLTCHFVNREWALVSCMLDTSLFPGSHTAERIAEKVNAALNLFCEPAKVVVIIHDQAANAVAAGTTLCKEQGWQSIPCSAHLLQTAARHAIDNCRPVQKLLASGRRLVGHFKHSNQATEMLLSRQKQLGESPLKPVQDVPTRWNSSFYMLERLLKLKLALHAVFQNDVHKKFRDLMMDDRQWKLAEEFVDVMRPLEIATSILGGQKCVTASLVLPVIVSVRDGLAAAGL